MIERFQKSYNGDRVTRPISGLSSHRAPLTGNIVELIIYDDHSLGTNTYNLSINGVAVFSGAGRPSIAGGAGVVIKTGLTQAVTKQDRVTLDVESVGSSGISSATWEVSYDDGLPTKWGGTSTTSLAIGTGSKAFTMNTTNLELAYVAGARVRAVSSSDSTKYMEGEVTSFTGSTLTISVDKIGGSGTVASWKFVIAGEPGVSAFALGTVSHTTASMASNAEVYEEVAGMGKSYIISSITADKACRVRLYRNDAFRTADISRPSGTLPTGEHGVILDVTFTGAGTLTLAPIPYGSSAESPRVTDASASIQNLDASTGTVTLDFDVTTLE